MPTEQELLDGVTTTKQNFSGTDFDSDDRVRIFRSRSRFWHKIFRIKKQGDSEDRAVIIPFNTFIEPFFSTDDVDLVESSGKYNATNHYYELYSDVLGNYKTIQSKVVSYSHDHKLRSVTLTVEAEYSSDGSNALDGVDLFVILGEEGGEEVVASMINGVPLYMRDYVGADLDFDLDGDLYAAFDNYFYGADLDADLDADLSGFMYQHKLKYKIVRTSDNKVLITKVILVVDWEW